MTQIDDRPAQPQPLVEERAPQKVTTPERGRRKRLSPGVIVGLGGAAVGIVGAALWGINSATSTSTPNGAPTPDDHASSASSTPSPEASSSPEKTDSGISIEKFEIPSNLSKEDLAKKTIEIASDWQVAGVSDALHKEAIASDLNSADFSMQEAIKTRDVLAPVVFGADWESNPDLTNSAGTGTVDRWTTRNASYITRWLATYDQPDKFTMSFTFVKAAQDPANPSIEDVTYTFNNNAKLNNAGTIQPDLITNNGKTFTAQATWSVAGDRSYISSYSN